MAIAVCGGCGALGTGDADGYCSACGHRLDTRAGAQIAVGNEIGGRLVVGTRSTDDCICRDTSGVEHLVILGEERALQTEAAAADSLRNEPFFPRFIEFGKDARRGVFLVLSALPPSARPLRGAALTLTMMGVVKVLRAALVGLEAAEKVGLSWEPEKTDLYLDETTLRAARIRTRPLLRSKVNAARTIATVGRALLPVATHGPLRLVRMLVEHGPEAPPRDTSIDAIRAELIEVENELVHSPNEPSKVPIGATCDSGLRRHHNEDAFAMASGETGGDAWSVVVVCDGVSCSSHAEQASAVASKTACDALATFARTWTGAKKSEGTDASQAMSEAIRAAHVAVCAASQANPPPDAGASETGPAEPPGTTIVAALLFGKRLTMGWVGDSRAYWLGTDGSELLTHDHSWVNEAVALGEMTEEEALLEPLAHALTHCLGPLELAGDSINELVPAIRERELDGSGFVVVCSDGLWNYFPHAEELAELVRSAGADATAPGIARYLTNHALARGGGDNVTVAVIAVP